MKKFKLAFCIIFVLFLVVGCSNSDKKLIDDTTELLTNSNLPPEVKFESRINASYSSGNTTVHLVYENEYFEHYGFVDVNRNVWDETFEPGSLQRTHTLLISLQHTLSF